MNRKIAITLGAIGGSLVSVCSVIEKIGGFVEKVVPIPSWLWLVLFLLGIISTFVFIFLDKIVAFFTPDISWRNDGFAYMTIEARFRDNFNKTGYKFKGHNEDDDHYAIFCQQKVMSATNITDMFPSKDSKDREDREDRENSANEYRAKLKKLMEKYNVSVTDDIQYLFANTPFIFAEHYYFYHILKLFNGADPWAAVKADSLKRIVDTPLENNRIAKLIEAYNTNQFETILNQSVFANSTDLSQTSARVKNTEAYNRDGVFDYVVNDRDDVQNYFENRLNDSKTIHIIVDNSGLELISDLILGACLINKGRAGKVVYHHNVLPIFVSDAVAADFEAAIESIKKIDTKVGNKIEKMRKSGKMEFAPNAFWNMPFPFKEMPERLLCELNKENVGMVIIKGDLNYRRLVEDKKWRITKSIKSRVNYLERPILILRSLKSDTLLGIDGATVKRYDLAQPNWKITGDYGMIQFIER